MSNLRIAASNALSLLHQPLGRWHLRRAVASAPKPLRLELGAWTTTRPGWVATDVHWRCANYLDGTRRWPIASESVEYLFSDNVVEHVPLAACRTLFREAYRVLIPGGTLRIVTPDVSALVALYLSEAGEAAPLRAELLEEGYLVAHQVDVLRFAFQDDGHHVGYLWDRQAMREELSEASFTAVQFHAPGESDTPELRDLERRVNLPISQIMLYVEARKPLADSG